MARIHYYFRGLKFRIIKKTALKVTKWISPLFVTNLLNMVSNNEIEHEVFKATSYRLKNEVVSWKAAVEIHSFFAKIIIVDLGNPTPALQAELEIIKESDFYYKTIIYDKDNNLDKQNLATLIDTNSCFIAHDYIEVSTILTLLIKDLEKPLSMENTIAKLGGSLDVHIKN